MKRTLKWSLTLAAAAATFVVCLWLAIEVAPQLMSDAGEADRWVVAAAFATVMASAVGICTSWWAGREKQREIAPPPATTLTPQAAQQNITASAQGATAQGTQGGGSIHNYNYGGEPPTGQADKDDSVANGIRNEPR